MATVIDPSLVPAESVHALSGEQLAAVLYALELLDEQCPLGHTLMGPDPVTCVCDRAKDLYNEGKLLDVG